MCVTLCSLYLHQNYWEDKVRVNCSAWKVYMYYLPHFKRSKFSVALFSCEMMALYTHHFWHFLPRLFLCRQIGWKDSRVFFFNRNQAHHCFVAPFIYLNRVWNVLMHHLLTYHYKIYKRYNNFYNDVHDCK